MGELISLCSKLSALNVTKNKCHHRIFSRCFFSLHHKLAASETLRSRLLSSQRSFSKYIFYDKQNCLCRTNIYLRNFSLQNEYIFKKDLYFICDTNIFCIKIYFQMRYVYFYVLIYIFLCKKSFFQ